MPDSRENTNQQRPPPSVKNLRTRTQKHECERDASADCHPNSQTVAKLTSGAKVKWSALLSEINFAGDSKPKSVAGVRSGTSPHGRQVVRIESHLDKQSVREEASAAENRLSDATQEEPLQ